MKACLLGGNSYTKCSITFVNIAVAISALAAGGGEKRFRTETRIRWWFRHFSKIFGCLSARGYWNGILGHFGSFPAMEKRPKMKKKTLYIARFCRVFGCQSIENTAKTSVLDWRYSKKRVNYRMLCRGTCSGTSSCGICAGGCPGHPYHHQPSKCFQW